MRSIKLETGDLGLELGEETGEEMGEEMGESLDKEWSRIEPMTCSTKFVVS